LDVGYDYGADRIIAPAGLSLAKTNGLFTLGRTTTTGSGPPEASPPTSLSCWTVGPEVRDMRRELGTSACTGAGVETVHKGRQGSSLDAQRVRHTVVDRDEQPPPFLR